MLPTAARRALFLLVLVAVPATIHAQAPPPSRVKGMFDQMRAGKYAQTGFDFPRLSWKDVPELLDRCESRTELRSFPTNPISSFAFTSRPEGVVALWLIEGVRKGNKYPSLNPRFHPAGDTDEERAANQKAVAAAYQAWWAKVKKLPPEKAADIDPLDGTKFGWQ